MSTMSTACIDPCCHTAPACNFFNGIFDFLPRRGMVGDFPIRSCMFPCIVLHQCLWLPYCTVHPPTLPTPATADLFSLEICDNASLSISPVQFFQNLYLWDSSMIIDDVNVGNRDLSAYSGKFGNSRQLKFQIWHLATNYTSLASF